MGLPSKPDHDVIIIGGGIVGNACALALSNRIKVGEKINIKILEKASSLRPVGAAIGLQGNGLASLEGISKEVFEEVKSEGIYLQKSILKNLQNEIVRENTDGDKIMYHVWYKLQLSLNKYLPPNTLQTSSIFEKYTIDPETKLVTVYSKDRSGNSLKSMTCSILIGADGINSAVRRQMKGEVATEYHGKMLFRAAFQHDSPHPDLPEDGIGMSWNGTEAGTLFAIRKHGDVYTITSMTNMDTPVYLPVNERRERLHQVFAEFPENVHNLIDIVPEVSIFENGLESLAQVVEDWTDGPVVLVGDAAHGMTSGLGQGANVGLEDAVELSYFISSMFETSNSFVSIKGDGLDTVLSEFCKSRIERVKHIHNLSSQMSANVRKWSSDNKSTFSREDMMNEAIKIAQWSPTKSPK